MLLATNTLEIEAEIDLQTAARIKLQITSGGKAPAIELSFDGIELRVADIRAPLPLARGERKLKLRIFVDRSVLEVFANETVCITKTIAPLDGRAALELRAEGGAANAKRIQAWPVKTIW